MTTTTNKGYTLPLVGGDFGTWGAELNTNWDFVDDNFGGVNSISVAGNSNVTASASQARKLAQVLTGVLTGNIHYILPALGGFYVVDNATTGAFTVTVITAAGGSVGISVPQGTNMMLWSDGTDIRSATDAYLLAAIGNLTINGTLDVTGTAHVSGVLTADFPVHIDYGPGNALIISSGQMVVAGACSLGSTVNIASVCSAASYVTTSDARGKENIRPVKDVDALAYVLTAEPVVFDKAGRESAGFIAQKDILNPARAASISAIPDDRRDYADGDGIAPPAHRLVKDYQHDIPYLTAALANALRRIALLEGRRA